MVVAATARRSGRDSDRAEEDVLRRRNGFLVALILSICGALGETSVGLSPGRIDGALAASLTTPGQPVPTIDNADPEQGTVRDGAYVNAYFGLAYALAPGWAKGLDGPPPSNAGLYVLSSFDGPGEARPSMLIVAQDLFFSPKQFASVEDAANDLRVSIGTIPGMTIDPAPADVRTAGHEFLSVSYHAGGIYRVWLATELRCHLLTFNVTSTDETTARIIALSLADMSLLPATDASLPVCIKGYVTLQTLIHRVDPAPVGPAFMKLPVRFIIGRDGHVRHVHVIDAFPEQRRAIEEALMQWRFRPYEVRGRPAEVETGFLFEFKPSGQ
jgi:hypothetical protein